MVIDFEENKSTRKSRLLIATELVLNRAQLYSNVYLNLKDVMQVEILSHKSAKIKTFHLLWSFDWEYLGSAENEVN